jgi:acyl-CoA thioesterase FadM
MSSSRAVSRSVFSVRSFDIDAHGYVNPVRLAGYLQQAASESADALGFGLSDLNPRGLTWVLVRQQWEMRQPIECRLGSSVSSRAVQQRTDRWLHSIVREDDQKELARAVSTWVAK